MTRRFFIERALRQIYNGQPTDDSSVTIGLVNGWLPDAIGLAAKTNWKENIQIEGIGFVNNGFHTTFKGIGITEDERFLYKFSLPEIPVGIGSSEGIAKVVFKDSGNNISYPSVMLSESQVSIQRSMRSVQNKILCYQEGGECFIITPIIMTDYTATVTMISGGDSTNLDSTLNVPPDYFAVMVSYIQQQLLLEKKQIPDLQNDGRDN